MNDCTYYREKFDDYLTCTLCEQDRTALLAHIRLCQTCRELLEKERVLRHLLRSDKAPDPSTDFINSAFAQVEEQYAPGGRRQKVRIAIGSVAAAVVLCLSFVVTMFQSEVESGVDSITMTINEVRSVTLEFDVPQTADDVVMTIQLPEHFELEGYPGRHQLRWKTDLLAGKNQLKVNIVARAISEGELTTKLEIGDEEKTFRTKIVAHTPLGSLSEETSASSSV